MSNIRYFLAKTEPAVYSITDLSRDGRTTWDGVRNAQARQAIQTMRPGDFVFIYHSGGVSAVVGLAKVASEPIDDPSAGSLIVDLEFIHILEEPVSLKTIKESGLFAEFALVRQSRLSTMETPAAFANWMRKQRPELKVHMKAG